MKVAACLIVKNEAPDIAEWIAYHALAGFDAFLVYDNASNDGTADVLQAAASLYDVRVTPWHNPSPLAQRDAYAHAMRAHAREFDWIAVIDSDEFLVVHGGRTVSRLCAAAGDAAAIAVNWAMFGSNGHVARPRALVVEAFTRRSEAHFPSNRHVKSIVRPGAVRACINPHAFAVEGRSVRPDGSPLVWEDDGAACRPGLTASAPDYQAAQVNHYFTRSRAHWARKVARSYPNPDSRHKLAHFEGFDRNEVEDRSALRSLASVRQAQASIMARLRQAAVPPPPWHPATLRVPSWQQGAPALAPRAPVLSAAG